MSEGKGRYPVVFDFSSGPPVYGSRIFPLPDNSPTDKSRRQTSPLPVIRINKRKIGNSIKSLVVDCCIEV